ncbi:PLP-dependent aminotransferase family protein [Alkalihalobacillus sp. 1P02AB]|uniref:aminotransferase-like domain-containing protein n=1 Tax=Alkalihalobacillus sp. 1P02AB TaxID=3132260 RepID=UPI0039A4C7D3
MSWKPNRSSSQSLYEQIKSWMMTKINQGEWVIGEKLPTQRKLAEQLEVNRSTIIQVLEELKAEGLLASKQGGYTYVKSKSWNQFIKNQPKLNWSRTLNQGLYKSNLDTIQKVNEYEFSPGIIRLGTGEMSPDLMPDKLIKSAIAIIQLDSTNLGYSESQGNLDLRQSLSKHLLKRGLHTSPENILIVSGALQALQLISLGLLDAKSYIFYDRPSYLPSIPSVHSLYCEQLKDINQHNGFYYTIPTLNNPTGDILNMEERKKIISSMNLPIIEDDVYHELAFEEAPNALKSLDHDGQVIYIGSISKTISPGLRIGWIVAPTLVINRLADLKMQLDYGCSTLSQQVISNLLNTTAYEDHMSHLRQQLKERASFMENLLEKLFSPIATWNSPKGGFYIWIKFKNPVVTKSLFQNLLKRNILINPGYLYYPKDFYHLRLSFAYCTFEEMEHGLSLLYDEIMKVI